MLIFAPRNTDSARESMFPGAETMIHALKEGFGRHHRAFSA
jgi:hypothetical protein